MNIHPDEAAGGNPPRPTAGAWASVAIFTIMAMLSYVDRQIIALLAVPIEQSLGISDFEMGILLGTSFGLFYAIAGIPMGWLADRFSRRRLAYLGVTFWSLATACCGLAGSFTQLALARFAVGAGEATLAPAVYSSLADRFPRHRLAFALSIFGTGAAIGSALALFGGGALMDHLRDLPPLVLPLIGVREAWQSVFLLVGLPGVLLALLILTQPEPERQQAPTAAGDQAYEDRVDLVTFMRRHWRYFACHFLGFGFIAVIGFSCAAWTAVVMVRTFDVTLTTAGVILGVALLLGNLPGFMVSGHVVDRSFARGRKDAHFRYYVWIAIPLGLIAALTFQFASSLPLFVVGMVAINFLTPFTGPAASHLQLVAPPQFRGRISAIYNVAFIMIGMGLGPPAVGFLTSEVFADPARVGSALAITCLSAGVAACLVFSLGLRAAQAAVN